VLLQRQSVQTQGKDREAEIKSAIAKKKKTMNNIHL
jgi:hypothetical protein